jgi:hypothetical protein
MNSKYYLPHVLVAVIVLLNAALINGGEHLLGNPLGV